MPENALANVSVDHVLPLEGIAQKLMELTMRPSDGSVPSASSAKVLIVEDERVVAEGLKDQLEDWGYQVCGSCGSGERAIELMAEVRPDIVLMDIRLAGALTGVEAARQIWDQFQIPTVYITAHADAETLQQAKTTATYGYIVKPFHPKAVHAAIQVALDRREKETRLL
jgi:CheY-like chemotaxis protein